MLRVNAIKRQELLKRLTFHLKSLVFKTVSVPMACPQADFFAEKTRLIFGGLGDLQYLCTYQT